MLIASRTRRKSKLVAITDPRGSRSPRAAVLLGQFARWIGKGGKRAGRIESGEFQKRFPSARVRRETKVKAKEEEEYGESGKDAVLSLRKKVLILLWVSVRCALMRTVRSQRTEKSVKALMNDTRADYSLSRFFVIFRASDAFKTKSEWVLFRISMKPGWVTIGLIKRIASNKYDDDCAVSNVTIVTN